MAQSPKYKVYRGGEYVGCVKHAADAAVLVAVQPKGQVRLGHKRVLWSEGIGGFAIDSYDLATEKILGREASEQASQSKI